MKEMIPRLWDDLAYMAGDKLEADQSVTLRIDDEEVELDLTEEHLAELYALLSPYLEAGHPTVSPTRPALRQRPVKDRRSIDYYEKLRAFSDEYGLAAYHSRGPGAKGRYTYKRALKKMYDEFVKTGKVPNHAGS
jgi:hypothetical protein